jgi:hypothetical protein
MVAPMPMFPFSFTMNLPLPPPSPDLSIWKSPFPPKIHLSPGVVMSTNLHLFREMRQGDSRLESLPAMERSAS